MSTNITVAEYLKIRLEQLGLQQMFGVAGNYTAAFLDTILADKESPISISGNANEICAGYAADAYARLNGICALYVTYSVGAFSLLNTIAGSFVEQVPVILINGAPTNKEDATEKNAGLLYSHTTGFQKVDIHMFRPITVAAERITNAQQAIYQIDSCLTALLTHKRPVYLEVTEDVWRAPCSPPMGTISSGESATITVSEAKAAAQATLSLMASRPKCLFWAGVELQRFGLQDAFLNLLEAANARSESPIGFVTSALSKSVLSEDHPLFRGCVTLSKQEVIDLVGDDGSLIGIGAWTTGKDTDNQDIRGPGTSLAANGGVFVGSSYFPSVHLRDYIEALVDTLESEAPTETKLHPLHPPSCASPIEGELNLQAALGYDNFFASISQWLTRDDILVVDAGFPLIGAQQVHIPEQNGFIAQAAWLAIGYSVAAGTGVSCAKPDKRAIVVVGDGAFHETCQAIGDQNAYGQNTVVFVLANGIYGIEQYLVNPNPFRTPPNDYSDPLQDKVYPYNQLPSWDIARLTEGFGGMGRKVGTLAELMATLEEIRSTPFSNFLVEVTIGQTDVPQAIARAAASKVGEDETENPGWPPAGVF